jgi:eukaryotic-like serine/threonine-protein kinase
MTTRPERVTRIGELVGAKYRIVRMIAEGGMGVVYEAQHTVVRRRFAVKFLRPDLAERRDILNRFQREAEAAGALESEHVAAAVDFGIVPDGTPYIVMEYLVGESLATLLEREGRLSVARAADLVSQAGRGIQVAHASGIIHRDLKPQNLFVCRRQDGTDLLKILDFGVAKLQAIDEMNASTRTGTVLGTVAYMSPEQARGDKIVDQRSDVYALGAILYELVSQKKPHPGESHNAVLHHIATHPAVPLESVQPGLPAGFIEIVARALSSSAEARPQSAEAFDLALAPFAERAVWPAPKIEDSGATRVEVTSTLLAPGGGARPTPPASSLAGLTVDERAVAPASGSGSASVSPARRRLSPLVALGAALAVGAIVVAVGVGTRRSAMPPAGSGGPGQGQASRLLGGPPNPVPVPAAALVAPAADGLPRPIAGPPPLVHGPAAAEPETPTTVSSRPVPPVGANGGGPARAARRRSGVVRTTATATASAPASPTPASRSTSVPITFDQQNPYK